METMRAQTNSELQDMIGRMFEADHPMLSIVATKCTHWDELLIPFVVPDVEPIYESGRVCIHAARAATLTVAKVTSWKWKAGGRQESDFLTDMRFTADRSNRCQFALQGTWSRLEATVSAPRARLVIGDEIRSYWSAIRMRSAGGEAEFGDSTQYGCMSDVLERAREEGIEVPEWVAKMTP